MATTPSTPANPTTGRDATVAKEIRVSVVMYGGVSLAIYMNGVAQEMLHMVRSTARAKSGENGTRFRFYDPKNRKDPNALESDCKGPLQSTEAVYRKVARALNDAGADDVRFIIDVISGTSAGGINGIFLAKALTDDSLTFNALQSLWVEEGALEKLLNDKATRKDTGLPKEEFPKSLLCGDRMYLKLLNAFGTMKGPSGEVGEPLAEEIDMFATTTDILGRVIPLRLADMLVWEREYKQDFHFRFEQRAGQAGNVAGGGDTKNDFEDRNNAFLAFVARCTSSFPFAFEPMQLSKAYELAFPKGVDPADKMRWNTFFDNSEQLDTGKNINRAFGDGGYLNNKPFSYVVEMLGRHRSDYPTERKLMYVDPTPDHPETEAPENVVATAKNQNAPDALTNSWDALVKLPDAQPIHEDLQRVIDRNRLVRKVQEMTSMVTAQIYDPARSRLQECRELDPLAVGDFSYLVTRIYSTTDDLSKVMTQWFDYSDTSSFYYAVRCLVRAWRELILKETGQNSLRGNRLEPGYKEFLRRFDIDYAKRRYRFVRQQINVFYTCDQTAVSRLRHDFEIDLPESEQDNFRWALIHAKGLFDAAHRAIGGSLRQIRPDKPIDLDGIIGTAFKNLQQKVNKFESENQAGKLESSGVKTAERIEGSSGMLSKSVVEYVLGTRPRNDNNPTATLSAQEDEDYIGRARKALPFLENEIQQFANVVSNILTAAMSAAADTVQKQLAEWAQLSDPALAVQAQQNLWQTDGAQQALHIVTFFNDCFEQFDTAIFSLTYETDVSTAELVSIVRISPVDATGIFDIPPRTQKLAGSTLAHFGAFLDRSFRTNDILWGRLDGAERIIHSMMATVRTGATVQGAAQLVAKRAADEKALIDEAQKAIVMDFLGTRRDELAGLLLEIAKSLKPPITDRRAQADAVRQAIKSTLGSLPAEPFKDAILSFLTVDQVMKYLRQPPIGRRPDQQTTLESVTRSVSIVGGMLQGLSEETKGAGIWLGRIGNVLWWIVQAASTRKLTGLLIRRALVTLMWLEVLVVLGGFIFNHAVFIVGIEMLAATIALWLIVQIIELYLLRKLTLLRRIVLWIMLLAALIAGLLFTPCGKHLRKYMKHKIYNPRATTSPPTADCYCVVPPKCCSKQ